MRKILAVLLAVAPLPALADEVPCGPLVAVTKTLAEGQYHEAPVARALAEHVMIIVFAAPDGATWTMVGVRAERPEIGCMMAAGTNWQAVKPPPPGNPS